MDAARHSNKSKARLRVVNEPGDLYAALTADGTRVKIGFSTRLSERIKALNHDFPGDGPFKLIGSTRSTYRMEMRLQRAMQVFHRIYISAGKELYPASPAVLAIVRQLMSEPTLENVDLDEWLEFRRWCHVQASLPENERVARVVHAKRFAERDEAARRNLERVIRRIEARKAAA